jgi:hypothetical protein
MLPIDPALIALAAEQGLLAESRVPPAFIQQTVCGKCGIEITGDCHGWWVEGAGGAVCTEDEGSHEPTER